MSTLKERMQSGSDFKVLTEKEKQDQLQKEINEARKKGIPYEEEDEALDFEALESEAKPA